MLRRLFGDDVAENDSHLSEYFIETPAYRMALSGEKRFFIGRKGVGKSAICQQLQRDLPGRGALCIPVAPQRVQFTALKLGLHHLDLWGKESDSFLQRVWYYGLLCEIALALTRSCKKANDSDFGRISAFVQRNYSHEEPNAFARLLKTVGVFMQQLEIGIGGMSVRRSSQISQIQVEIELDKLRLPIASFIARNIPQGVYVLVDNLDEGWDNSEVANAFVRGLLLAVYEICQPNIPVRLIVFFPSDMYNRITSQFPHIDKYRQFQETINWGRKEIMDLVAQRIRVNRPFKIPATAAEVWARVFEEESNTTSLPHYIIDRSLLRPREVLQFCRLAAEKADEHGHLKVTYEDVCDAEKEYSRWKIDDLSNEFLFGWPGLKEGIFQRFYGSALHMSIAEIHRLLEDALTDPRVTSQYAWMDSMKSVDDLIQILYGIGFLICRSQRKEWQSAEHADFNLALAEGFTVHPAFRNYLRIG